MPVKPFVPLPGPFAWVPKSDKRNALATFVISAIAFAVWTLATIGMLIAYAVSAIAHEIRSRK